jgi:hypothetical protein
MFRIQSTRRFLCSGTLWLEKHNVFVQDAALMLLGWLFPQKGRNAGPKVFATILIFAVQVYH